MTKQKQFDKGIADINARLITITKYNKEGDKEMRQVGIMKAYGAVEMLYDLEIITRELYDELNEKIINAGFEPLN